MSCGDRKTWEKATSESVASTQQFPTEGSAGAFASPFSSRRGPEIALTTQGSILASASELLAASDEQGKVAPMNAPA